jgi:hypothetical protein
VRGERKRHFSAIVAGSANAHRGEVIVAETTKHAVFLGGPIGAGKSTLGRALAERLDGGFIEGDDHSDPERPWYGSILTTSRGILAASVAALQTSRLVVIAYPFACTNYVFFRRRLGDVGASTVLVSLRASWEGIIAPGRGREFTPDERDRLRVMIAEGYGERPFSDLVVDTDRAGFAETVEMLREALMPLIGR